MQVCFLLYSLEHTCDIPVEGHKMSLAGSGLQGLQLDLSELQKSTLRTNLL